MVSLFKIFLSNQNINRNMNTILSIFILVAIYHLFFMWILYLHNILLIVRVQIKLPILNLVVLIIFGMNSLVHRQFSFKLAYNNLFILNLCNQQRKFVSYMTTLNHMTVRQLHRSPEFLLMRQLLHETSHPFLSSFSLTSTS